MKNTFLSFVLALTLSVLTSSCTSDDDPDFGFIDQKLQGKISGQAWSFEDGRFFEGLFIDNEWFMGLMPHTIPNDTCYLFLEEGLYVNIVVSNKEGLYHLSNTSLGLVFLVDGLKSSPLNLIDGVVEILEVTEAEISGRIAGSFDEENFLNGNFSVQLCQESDFE